MFIAGHPDRRGYVPAETPGGATRRQTPAASDAAGCLDGVDRANEVGVLGQDSSGEGLGRVMTKMELIYVRPGETPGRPYVIARLHAHSQPAAI